MRAVLGDCFIGMYLYGSLAIGDFDPDRSDIDFLVVTSKELPDDIVAELKFMNTRPYKSGMEWSTKLEGSYVPRNVFRRYSANGPALPMTNKDKFVVAHEDVVWLINSYVLYTGGVAIAGSSLRSIIDPVQPEELKDSVLTLLRDVWTPWLDNSDLFKGDEYQSYVVLTMCRALFTLKRGAVVSKLRSAEWVISNLDRKWGQLIRQALARHYGTPPGNIGQAQEFMRYILKEAGL